MSRPRSVNHRAARTRNLRPGLGRAAIAVGVLALGACGSSDPEAPPPPCPTAVLLDGAERTSAYRAGAQARPDELRYIAVLTDLSTACRYFDDARGKGVDVDLSFKLIAERGPALSGSEEVTYFVATLGPDNQILAKEVLSGDLPFTGDEERVGLAEDLTLRLPAITPAQAADYTLYVGFQLDDAELTRRQQPSLR